MAATVVVFGPWWLRLARDLVAERQARTGPRSGPTWQPGSTTRSSRPSRSSSGSADQPQEVAKLARAQERELRSWLFEGRAPGSSESEEPATCSRRSEQIEREVEAAHGVRGRRGHGRRLPRSTRSCGRCSRRAGRRPSTPPSGPGPPIGVALRRGRDQTGRDVRPRPRHRFRSTAAVADDRQGIAESIRGRMHAPRRLGRHPLVPRARAPRSSSACRARAGRREPTRGPPTGVPRRRPSPVPSRACAASSATRSRSSARRTRSLPPSS